MCTSILCFFIGGGKVIHTFSASKSTFSADFISFFQSDEDNLAGCPSQKFTVYTENVNGLCLFLGRTLHTDQKFFLEDFENKLRDSA